MPNQSVESLDILPLYADRATYQNVLGTQAPIFDPTIEAIKLWADTAAASLPATALMTYTKFNNDTTTPALVQFTVPAAVAARVNMVGKPAYAKYFIAPTNAVGTFAVGGFTQTVAVQPNTLSLRAQADALATINGAMVVDAATQNAFVAINWPNDEPRRQWTLVYQDNQEAYAGDLLASQNQAGIGAPGHWDKSDGHLTWVVDPIPDGTDKVYPTMDVPKRGLADGESLLVLANGAFGFKQVVLHTADPAVPLTGDSAVLAQIAKQIQFIYTEMGGK